MERITDTPAVAAGPATPENDKARGQAGFVRDQEATGNGADSAQAGHAAQLAEALRRKRVETLTACLALKGFELRQLAGGAWLITKWNLTRELGGPGLEAVEVFAAQVGATD